MIVGLLCCHEGIYEWQNDYSEFELDPAYYGGEGNIVPFYEDSGGQAMDTWCKHTGPVQAMAVVPDKYLLRLTRLLNGTSDALMQWDLSNPGVPLIRHNQRKLSSRRWVKKRTRLGEIVGIAALGAEVMFGCS
jgi:hypothetical protein